MLHPFGLEVGTRFMFPASMVIAIYYRVLPCLQNVRLYSSHLMGLFYRTIRLVEHGIKPVYVFDGKPPEMKSDEVRNFLYQLYP